MVSKFVLPLAVLTMTFNSAYSTGLSHKTNGQIYSGSQEIHVLNVQDYIAPNIEEDFEEYARSLGYSNVNLIYETTDTPETMLNLLKTGDTYDVICPSDYMIQRMGNEGLIEPLDLTIINTDETDGIDNYSKYVSKKIREYLDNCFVDQECYKNKDSEYMASHPLAVGYMWGTLGILFNPYYGTQDCDETIFDMQTWDVFWNKKYQNTMTVKDSMRDTYAVGLIHTYYDDYSLNGVTMPGFSTLKDMKDSGQIDSEEYNKRISSIFNMDAEALGDTANVIDTVLEDLLDMKKVIRGLEVDTGKNDIVAGKIGTNLAWSGDAVYSMELGEEAREPVELWYSVPEEGSNIFFDGWCMPKNPNRSPAQKALAMEFLNYISNPEHAAENMDETGYTSFIAGDEILDLAREWYDCRYDEEDLEDCWNDLSEQELLDNVNNEGWQSVDLSYFFEGTLNEHDDSDMIFYTNEDTGLYLPYLDDGNISCGTAFFCQYPNEETVNRCCVMQDFGEYNKNITQMWEKFKSTALETWAIILFSIEIASALGVGGYFFYRSLKRKKLKELRKLS